MILLQAEGGHAGHEDRHRGVGPARPFRSAQSDGAVHHLPVGPPPPHAPQSSQRGPASDDDDAGSPGPAAGLHGNEAGCAARRHDTDARADSGGSRNAESGPWSRRPTVYELIEDVDFFFEIRYVANKIFIYQQMSSTILFGETS